MVYAIRQLHNPDLFNARPVGDIMDEGSYAIDSDLQSWLESMALISRANDTSRGSRNHEGALESASTLAEESVSSPEQRGVIDERVWLTPFLRSGFVTANESEVLLMIL